MPEAIHMSPEAFRASEGKFDASKRYLRSGATGSFFPMPKGATLDAYEDGHTTTATSTNTLVRYSVSSYAQQRTDLFTGTFGADATLTTL